MSTIPLPDLDNDTVTYRFLSIPGTYSGYGTTYDIWRRINGGPEHLIGSVRKTRDSGWNQPAEWSATSYGDNPKYGRGDTRAKAARALEYSLQPTEWHERKRAEYLAEDAARRAEDDRRKEEEAAQRAELQGFVDRLGFGKVNDNGPGTVTFTPYEISRLSITRKD